MLAPGLMALGLRQEINYNKWKEFKKIDWSLY